MKVSDHVRANMSSSKFSPNYEEEFYVVIKAFETGYYRLADSKGNERRESINGKWLKKLNFTSLLNDDYKIHVNRLTLPIRHRKDSFLCYRCFGKHDCRC